MKIFKWWLSKVSNWVVWIAFIKGIAIGVLVTLFLR